MASMHSLPCGTGRRVRKIGYKPAFAEKKSASGSVFQKCLNGPGILCHTDFGRQNKQRARLRERSMALCYRKEGSGRQRERVCRYRSYEG